MIFTALINLAYYVASAIIYVFPDSAGFPTEAFTAVQSLGQYLHIFDPLVPISTLLTCVTLILTIEIVIWSFKALRWVISHIPYVGGHA